MVPEKDLKALGTTLTPNTSAMLLLLEDTESEGLVNSMAAYDANVVTLTVGNDLSGEIAQYVAARGALRPLDGNLLATSATRFQAVS